MTVEDTMEIHLSLTRILRKHHPASPLPSDDVFLARGHGHYVDAAHPCIGHKNCPTCDIARALVKNHLSSKVPCEQTGNSTLSIPKYKRIATAVIMDVMVVGKGPPSGVAATSTGALHGDGGPFIPLHLPSVSHCVCPERSEAPM